MTKGIDVSQHNDEIDFKAVKNDGIKFVILDFVSKTLVILA